MSRLRSLLISDPCVILGTLFFGTLSLIASLFDRTGVPLLWLAGLWARTLLWTSGVKVSIEGLDRISPSGSYVFVANHLSYMDTPVLLANIPVQFRFLAKHGLFKIPLLGNHLKSAGHIPVPREDPRGAVKTMQLAAETIQTKGISLLIFPEGGRSRDGCLRTFKEGAAYIAIRAGVPVVPVVIMGTREVLPFGSGLVRSGHVTVRVMKPILTNQLVLKNRGQLTEEIRSVIANELGPKVTAA